MMKKGNRKFNLGSVLTPEGNEEISKHIKNVLYLKDEKYKGLNKLIADPIILLSAFEKIVKNDGYYTQGVNKQLLTTVDVNFFQGLSKEIGSGIYKPSPSRRVMIPKPDGKFRPLGISCSIDKIVQEAMRFVLAIIYEPKFLDCSHGFRTNKSCHTALNQYKMQFSSVT
jgi:retron-type reverse transcriptase